MIESLAEAACGSTSALGSDWCLFWTVVRELSHAVPDVSIHGILSSVHISLDSEHYKLIRGLLEKNLGEPVEEFLRPYNLQDPSIHVRKWATTWSQNVFMRCICSKCPVLFSCCPIERTNKYTRSHVKTFILCVRPHSDCAKRWRLHQLYLPGGYNGCKFGAVGEAETNRACWFISKVGLHPCTQ